MPNRPARIAVIATKNIRENPFRDVNLTRAFKARGMEATLALLGPHLSAFGYAATDVNASLLTPDQVVWVNHLRDYARLVRQVDAVLIGFWRDNKLLVRLARAYGKLVLEYDSVSGMDDWSFGSHAMLLKGPFLRRISEASYRDRYPEMQFLSPGTVAHELPDGTPPLPGREAFCQRYDLDPRRKIAAFYPKGIKVFEDKLHMWFKEKGAEKNTWYLDRYDAICKAARDAGVNLILKLHPSAYASYRTRRDLEYEFWGKYPWAAILEPDDTYACYHHADVGISIISHSALDYGYFRHPFIYVDIDQAPLPPFLDKHLAKGQCSLPPGPSRQWESGESESWRPYFQSWVGAACRPDQLADLLISGDYVDPDPTHYDRFIEEFWHRADGKSAERIVDYTLTALDSYQPRMNYRQIARLTWQGWRAGRD